MGPTKLILSEESNTRKENRLVIELKLGRYPTYPFLQSFLRCRVRYAPFT